MNICNKAFCPLQNKLKAVFKVHLWMYGSRSLDCFCILNRLQDMKWKQESIRQYAPIPAMLFYYFVFFFVVATAVGYKPFIYQIHRSHHQCSINKDTPYTIKSCCHSGNLTKLDYSFLWCYIFHALLATPDVHKRTLAQNQELRAANGG